MIRRRLGWPSTDDFVSDAELVDMLLESRKELFDFMVSIHQGSYRLGTQSLTTVPGRNLYALQFDPDGTIGDIFGDPIERIVRIAATFDNISVPLRKWQPETDVLRIDSITWEAGMDLQYRFGSGFFFGEMFDRLLYVYPTPANAVVLDILYNVGPAGTTSISQTGIINDLENDEYLVLDGMIKCLQMEETDASAVMAQKERLIQRLTNEAAPLDEARPDTIHDARGAEEDMAAMPWRRW